MTEIKLNNDPTEYSGDNPVTDSMFHPTFLAADRAEIADWLKRVFRVKPMFQRDFQSDTYADTDDAPDAKKMDYSLWTWISDVLFDVKEPSQRGCARPRVNHLTYLAWRVDPQKLIDAAEQKGIRLVPFGGHDGKISPYGQTLFECFTDERDVGMAQEMMRVTRDAEEIALAKSMYPRWLPGWKHPDVSPDDPLGIMRASHHTVLTYDIPRALSFTVDVLGGRVIHEARNALLQTDSTYVWLADSVIEYAVPLYRGEQVSHGSLGWTPVDGDTSPAFQDWHENPLGKARAYPFELQEDVSHAITFIVQDLNRAIAHLKNEGIGFELKDDHMVVTDPKDCLGMRWGFTDRLIPGDPRAIS